MPLRGGSSDKFGNAFEGKWTVYCMLQVLMERARSIHLEPPGPTGDGIEFILRRYNGIQEHHQVKRQTTYGVQWNTTSLSKVLKNFKSKLDSSANIQCHFISQTSVAYLGELAERARTAQSFVDFEAEFMGSKHFARPRADFCKTLSCSSAGGDFNLLQRIWFKTLGEQELQLLIEELAQNLIHNADPVSVTSILAKFAIDQTHKLIHADVIWEHLQSVKMMRRPLLADPLVKTRIDDQNRRYYTPINEQLISGKNIERKETREIVQRIVEGYEPGVLLIGEAGTGKTCVLNGALSILRDELQWPVLAIRIDRLKVCETLEQIGDQIGLMGSPVHVLHKYSGDRRCLLIVDQVDAVSEASGRHPHFFDRVKELVDAATKIPTMRILLSCRKFDADNDSRIRRIAKQPGYFSTIELGGLPNDVIIQTVSLQNTDRQVLSDIQTRLLQNPLNLRIFGELPSATADTLTNRTALLREYWKMKEAAVRTRLSGIPTRWLAVITRTIDIMVEGQTLAVDSDLLDDISQETTAAMLSEGVLIRESNRIAFFHECFFDYCCARMFRSRENDLLKFLLEREQRFQLRTTVRQILEEMRTPEDPNRHIENLSQILHHNQIRFHIKQIIYGWLSSLNDPSRQEYFLVLSLLAEGPQDLVTHIKAIVFRPPWFQLLDRLGVLDKNLESADEGTISDTVRYLGWASTYFPKRVVALIERYLIDKPGGLDHILNIMRRAHAYQTKKWIRLYATLLDREPSSRIVPIGSSSLFLHELPQKRPQWMIELVAYCLPHILPRALEDLIAYKYPRLDLRHEILHDGTGWTFCSLARRRPRYFLRTLFGTFLDIIRLTAIRISVPARGSFSECLWWQRTGTEFDPPFIDRAWPRYSRESSTWQDDLLEAIIISLVRVAKKNDPAFKVYIEDLRQHSHFRTTEYVLARVYTKCGPTHIVDASAFLCQTSRLCLSYDGARYWVSRELLSILMPICSDSEYRRIETMVLDYYPSVERMIRRREWGTPPTYLGDAQLTLLNGFASSTAPRFSRAHRRLQEHRRRFSRMDNLLPEQASYEPEDPPVSSGWRFLRDRHWMAAMAKHPGTKRERLFWANGEATVLASNLTRQATLEPKRFAHLFLRLATDTDPCYPMAILEGLSEARSESDRQLEPELVWDLIRHCHKFSTPPPCHYIWRIVNWNKAPPPEDIAALMIEAALNGATPTFEDVADEAMITSLQDSGIGSIRGWMPDVIHRMLFAHPDIFPRFDAAMDIMVSDVSILVRAQVAMALLPVINISRDRASELFFRLIDCDLKIFTSSWVRNLLDISLSVTARRSCRFLKR